MKITPELSRFISEYYRSLERMQLTEVSFSTLKECRQLLVLCSGSPILFQELVKLTWEQAPECLITVIAPKQSAARIAALQEDRLKLFVQPRPGRLEWSQVREPALQLSFDRLIALFNSVWGAGYDNVREICHQLNLCEWYAYNCLRQLLLLDSAILREQQKAHADITRLADEVWQHLGQTA